MNLSIIILAAGRSTRINSAFPKVMHKIAERPILGYILEACKTAHVNKIILVTSKEMEEVRKFAEGEVDYINHAIQEAPLGTGDAVKAALEFLPENGRTIILYGDAPFVQVDTINKIKNSVNKLALVAFNAKDPTPYGRVIVKENKLSYIVESKDAQDEELDVKLCNSGIYSLDNQLLFEFLPKLNNANSKKEYYLTDIIKYVVEKGYSSELFYCLEEEALGINDRKELANAQNIMQIKLKNKLLAQGVSLIMPETIYVAYDFVAGKDVTIYPNVFIGKKVQVGDNVTIHSFSHLEGSSFKNNVSIGPFARTRPTTIVDEGSKIGNFVEIKNSVIKENSKINHLSYVGDAFVGSKTNIGAGTIVCNFDGISKKSQTHIGNNVSVGSNSCLVSPLIISDGAFVAAGSVITKNIADDEIAFGRARQVNMMRKARQNDDK